jgi:glycogen debranching enzyme
MRHLSRWRLLVDEEPIHVLANSCVDYYSARIVGTLASAGHGQSPPVSVRRDRFVADGVHEDLVVENHSEETRALTVELCFGSDFGDILQCKSDPKNEGKVTAEVADDQRSVTLVYTRDDHRRGTRISFTAPCRLERERAVFEIELAPRETWRTCIDVGPEVDGSERRPRQGCDSFGQGKPRVPLEEGKLRTAASTPPEIGELRLRGVQVGGGRVDVGG